MQVQRCLIMLNVTISALILELSARVGTRKKVEGMFSSDEVENTM